MERSPDRLRSSDLPVPDPRRGVAASAAHGRVRTPELHPDAAMIEPEGVEADQLPVRTEMIPVAGATVRRVLGVKPSSRIDPLTEGDVTRQTAIACGAALAESVTGRAVPEPLELTVRRRQLSRRDELGLDTTSAGPRHPRRDQDRRTDAGSRQKIHV